MRNLTAAVLVAVLVASCSGRHRLPRHDPPPEGEVAEVGVAYGLVVYCPIPIELGGKLWLWDRPVDWPEDISIPPFPWSIFADVGTPYAVPGILTLTSPNTAQFRADVDGSVFDLRAASNPSAVPEQMCL